MPLGKPCDGPHSAQRPAAPLTGASREHRAVRGSVEFSLADGLG